MSLESGRMLAQYRLVEKIGEGGMGAVWRAVDTDLDREVAVKILSADFSGQAQRMARFEREAKLLASINHPSIATVYGLHRHEGLRFLAMELIPGSDLERRLAQGPLPMAEALTIARQIAAALEATHERGVIHRDLKPANVYVTPSGDAKVLDFGIARDVTPGVASAAVDGVAPERTEPGTILGTVSYMSPEQARGGAVDARTDLWSFGCVLYRMLCGRPAFDGATRWDKLAAVLREEPDWNALPDETPDAVRDLLRRCLVKDVDRRLDSAGTARRVLDDVLGLSTAPGEAVRLLGRPRRRARIVAGVVLVTALLAVALGLWLQRSGEISGALNADGSPDRSIAILPFVGVGDEQGGDAFTTGIHDDILNHVAKIGDLRVISRTSVMDYRGTKKNLKQIAEELGVATVLEGSVQRSGDQVRINVQLIDAATDENLWAESYNRALSAESLFEIQSEIAERIASSLQATLSADERRRIDELPTADLDAYDAYLKGLDLYLRDGKLAENLMSARTMFQRAIDADPGFAMAYAGLSRAARDHYWFAGGQEEALDAAVAAAERALAIDPDLPEAYLALGTSHYVRREYEQALDALRIAERGLPGNSELMRWKAYIVRRRGMWDEALRDLRRGFELNPRDPESALEVGFTLLNMRRYDEADEYLAVAADLAPTYPVVLIYRGLLRLLRDGTPESARAAFERIDGATGVPWKYAHGWQALIDLREYDRAVEFVGETERIAAQWHDYPTELLAGWARLLQGRDAEAHALLETARTVLEADVSSRPDDARLHGALGVTYALLGRDAAALLEGQRAVELMPIDKDTFVGTWQLQDLAWIEARCGEPDAAIESLDRILSVPSVWSIEALELDPRVDPLRDRPGFAELVAKHRRAG